MCRLTEPITDKKIVTGYKYALKKGKKYYSPVTGVEYKLGKITRPKKQKLLDEGWNDCILDRDDYYFNFLFFGKTAIFHKIQDAFGLLNDIYIEDIAVGYTPVVLKMKLSKNLFIGFFEEEFIYAGEYIESIKEVKQF